MGALLHLIFLGLLWGRGKPDRDAVGVDSLSLSLFLSMLGGLSMV